MRKQLICAARRRWAPKGAKVRVTKNGDHLRMNITGIVCPRTGVFYALEFSHTDTETFRCSLEHANWDIQRPRKRNLLIMHNASWRQCQLAQDQDIAMGGLRAGLSATVFTGLQPHRTAVAIA